MVLCFLPEEFCILRDCCDLLLLRDDFDFLEDWPNELADLLLSCFMPTIRLWLGSAAIADRFYLHLLFDDFFFEFYLDCLETDLCPFP